MSLFDGCILALCPAHQGGSGSTLTDYSGNGRTGVLVNFADLSTAWGDRYGCRTVRLDGVDDAINVDFGSNQALGDATVAIWVARLTNRPFDRALDGNYFDGLWIGIKGGGGAIGGAFRAASDPYGCFATVGIGEFVHLMITRTAAGLNTIYLDGEPVGGEFGTFMGVSGPTNFRYLSLGQDAPGTANLECFQGDVAALWMWNRVLGASERIAHAASPTAPFEAPPASFPFWKQRKSGLLTKGL